MFLELAPAVLLLVLVVAFLSAILHGATGMAGGIVMAAILSHILGIKQTIPVISCALVFSHCSRIALYWRDTDWSVCKRVLLFGCPGIIFGAYIFAFLSPRLVAIIFALFLIASFPVKHWANKHQLKTSNKVLAMASSVWGVLAGNVIGPGFFLAPFLLGTGMNRLAFVGTLAIITLIMNLIKLSVFGAVEVLNYSLFTLGVIIGLITIPGNWLGRHILKKMDDQKHKTIIDVLTVMVIINFIYLAVWN